MPGNATKDLHALENCDKVFTNKKYLTILGLVSTLPCDMCGHPFFLFYWNFNYINKHSKNWLQLQFYLKFHPHFVPLMLATFHPRPISKAKTQVCTMLILFTHINLHTYKFPYIHST